ncbi:MAG: hypothetical protein OEP48_01880 [Betaproteobacteria bacterium]|nr:hypothetical protein [Betaproteobacteria bacterium]MDH3437563.1 hypothetical protein [Betaproteobacteria bacterium]
MELVEGIRKIGFRRWYERQLLQSHLYLASALLCLVAVLAALEGFHSREVSFDFFIGLVGILVGGAIGSWAFLRYIRMLVAAQYAADRSVCAKCKTYGVLEATGSPMHAGSQDADVEIAPTRVRCRKCANEWTIE